MTHLQTSDSIHPSPKLELERKCGSYIVIWVEILEIFYSYSQPLLSKSPLLLLLEIHIELDQQVTLLTKVYSFTQT